MSFDKKLVVKNRTSGYFSYYFGPLENLGAYAPGPLGKSNPAIFNTERNGFFPG